MTQAVKPLSLKTLFTFLCLFAVQAVLWAQDSGGASTTTTTTSTSSKSVSLTSDNWYASPWVWVVGAAVFILLLVALVGGNRGRSSSTASDRVTVTKTVERDSDV